jgi:predicted O-methyltransferase YrrM
MASHVHAAEILAVVEDVLVKHPAFGDSSYIQGQLDTVFRRRLDRVAAHLGEARKLSDALAAADLETRRRVAGCTVIRCAVHHAHGRLEAATPYGLAADDCAQLFEAAARHLSAGRAGTPFENGSAPLERLGTEDCHGWIWDEAYPDDLFGRAFRQILDVEYGGGLVSAEPEQLAVLRKGDELLRELLPSLSRSALRHAHLIGCFPDVRFWKGKLSSSQIRVGGVIFLNQKMLTDPWVTAEHLLHESLHHKLYDFRHGHTLLDPETCGERAPKVWSAWNAPELTRANCWDVHRAFAAFHVYVQLALLALVAERRRDELEPIYGENRAMICSRKALERARWLGERLGDDCFRQLGEAGRRMRDWLMSILDALDPAPPPKGAYVHLVLDLYQREANRVESVLRQDEQASAALARELAAVVDEEVADARELLAIVGGGSELDELQRSLQGRPVSEIGRSLPEARRLIARSLLAASLDGYGLGAAAPAGVDADARVRQFVETGSERLYLIQDRVPAAVAGAKRRARDFYFTKSCDDRVGRLLSTLAAAVPAGGRILEIGTGVGVGLGWIVTGLKHRTDVEVVSIEGDLRLSKAARLGDWPGYVEIVTDDALAALPHLGTFDLVFADAAPVKYRDVGLAVNALRPGGLLLVDDLCPTAAGTEQQLAEREALRETILRHPCLQAVELDWATHLILATMTAPSGPTASGPLRAGGPVLAPPGDAGV